MSKVGKSFSVFKPCGSLYKICELISTWLGVSASANFGMNFPQGFVVIGDTKFFSVPFLNLILQEIVPFYSSLLTLTLWPIGAKSAYPLTSIAWLGHALTHE